MAEIRVYELAKELGRQNREVIVELKKNGVDVKSHMSRIDGPSIQLIKEKFSQRSDERRVGKECVDTCRSRRWERSRLPRWKIPEQKKKR